MAVWLSDAIKCLAGRQLGVRRAGGAIVVRSAAHANFAEKQLGFALAYQALEVHPKLGQLGGKRVKPTLQIGRLDVDGRKGGVVGEANKVGGLKQCAHGAGIELGGHAGELAGKLGRVRLVTPSLERGGGGGRGVAGWVGLAG